MLPAVRGPPGLVYGRGCPGLARPAQPGVGHLPSCTEWRRWRQSLVSWLGLSEPTEGCPFPFGRTPSLTPSRSQSCISCIASCLWQRAGRGSPVLPTPAESAAAVSWTCPRETTVRPGSCSWTCPCSVPSFEAPACLMPCACIPPRWGPFPLNSYLSLLELPLPLPTSLTGPVGLEGCCSPPSPTGPRSPSSLLLPPLGVSPCVSPAQSVPFSFSCQPADHPLPSTFQPSSSPPLPSPHALFPQLPPSAFPGLDRSALPTAVDSVSLWSNCL